MTVRQLQNLPQPGSFSRFSDVTIYMQRVWAAIYKIRRGKLECVVEFTLTANVATTILRDERLSAQSVVHLDPKTANAAAELGNGTAYCLTVNRGVGVWTFTHVNNAQADRLFQLSILG